MIFKPVILTSSLYMTGIRLQISSPTSKVHGEGRSQTLAWEEDLEILEATRVRVRVVVQVNMGPTYVDRSNNALSSFGVMTNARA